MYQTKKQIKKKKRIKKIIFFFSIFLIIWISFGLYLTLNQKKYDNNLEKLGYSKTEINIIESILTTKQRKKLYNYKYIDNLTDILLNKEFKNDKLTNYIDYNNKYKNIDINDLLYIINNNYNDLEYNEFNKEIIHNENFDYYKHNRYEKYYNKYKLNIEDTIKGVNKDFDIYDIKYDEKYLEYLDKDYFILSNLKRYYEYKKKNKKKSIDEVITIVNCNLDNNTIKNADIDKGILILVNKHYTLDKDYVPNNLVNIDKIYGNGMLNEEAYNSFIKMYEDAKKDNVKLNIIRGYTSYNEQNKLYNKNKKYYFKPGTSEFQTGLIVELSYNEWLDKNAHEYGFILRYPEDKKDITGIYNKNYYRYVSKDISKFIYKHNITYEEYYAYFIEDK